MLQIERWFNGATVCPNQRVKKDRLLVLLTEVQCGNQKSSGRSSGRELG